MKTNRTEDKKTISGNVSGIVTASVFTSDKRHGLKPIEDSTEAQKQAQESTEALTASEMDYQYYKNRIDETIKEYEIENDCNIKDIKKSEWNAVLIYIYNHVFKLSKADNIQKYKHKPYNDSDLMLLLCDYYIYLCYFYNKPINIIGFNHMLNLSSQYLYRHSKNETYTYIDIDNNNTCINSSDINNYKKIYPYHNIVRVSNITLSTIRQKLVYNSERSLQDMALDGSVMALAVGKIVHGWEEGKRAQVQAQAMEKYTLPQDILKEYSENN